MRRAVFLLYQGFELLDFAGPLQVLHEARERGLELDILVCGISERLSCEQGPVLSELPPPPRFEEGDWVFVPGLTLSRTPIPDELVAALKRADKAGARLIATCSGAFALGRAGLLDGRFCTTHWKRIDELRESFPKAKVLDERLFIEDGNVITCGGNACGIDMTLFLMDRERGPLFASQLARELVIYVRRDQNQPQTSIYLDYRAHGNPGVHAVQDWLIEHPDTSARVDEMARIGGMSPRNFTRVFRGATGISPAKYRTVLRMEKAMILLRNPRLTVEAVASECGFTDARTLRRLWKSRYGVPPRRQEA